MDLSTRLISNVRATTICSLTSAAWLNSLLSKLQLWKTDKDTLGSDKLAGLQGLQDTVSLHQLQGGPAMKISLIPGMQNTEAILIRLLCSEGQEGMWFFSLLALWISVFAPFYFSGLLNDQNRHYENSKKQVPLSHAVVICSICCYLFIKVHPLNKNIQEISLCLLIIHSGILDL